MESELGEFSGIPIGLFRGRFLTAAEALASSIPVQATELDIERLSAENVAHLAIASLRASPAFSVAAIASGSRVAIDNERAISEIENRTALGQALAEVELRKMFSVRLSVESIQAGREAHDVDEKALDGCDAAIHRRRVRIR